MNNFVIQTENLTRRYGHLTAVERLNLNVPQGSIYGFLGLNGAGKTTTIRMLLGLIRPSAGEVRLFGQPLRDNPPAPLDRIGSLVEAPSFYPHLTGWENLEVIRRLRDGTKTQIERALCIVGLEKDAHRLAGQYSHGMCQRLGLAIALLSSPDLLILDEPTEGLDPVGIHEIRELIRRLPQESGVTVFLSSHLLNEVELTATQIGIIRNGRLIFQGTPEQLHASYQDYLSIGVDSPEKASQILQQNGWKYLEQKDHHLRVIANGLADAACLNALLVKSDVNVYHLNLERPNLEDIFLTITSSQEPIKEDLK